jgi:hypothetical protein
MPIILRPLPHPVLPPLFFGALCTTGIRAGAHGLFATGFDTRVSDTKHIMRAHITDSCWTKVVKDHARLSPQSLVGAVISPKRFWFDLETDLGL